MIQQKKFFLSMKKQIPTLKIKNITFSQIYTQSMNQNLLSYPFPIDRSKMAHKFYDSKNKNKQNILQTIQIQNIDTRNNSISSVSFKPINLPWTSKALLHQKNFIDKTNAQTNQLYHSHQTQNHVTSEFFEGRNLFKSKTFVDKIKPAKRQSSTSQAAKIQKKKPLKPQHLPQTVAMRKKKLIPCTSDKIFEVNFFQYLEFLNIAAQSHQIKITFEDYQKPYTVIIGKGNNSKLVKEVLKKRWWLKVEDKKGAQPINFTETNFAWTQMRVKEFYLTSNENNKSFHNHFEHNGNLGNKKGLFSNLKKYYSSKNMNPFDFIPLTFHVKSTADEQFKNFKVHYLLEKEQSQLWIIKPGQNSNRGCGITINSQIQEIEKIINEENEFSEKQKPKCQSRTFIIQKYIEKPFLYQKRKFDIRCYYLLVCLNQKIKAYWYKEGYIRTSCFQFNCNDQNKENLFVHLTNDAVQKHHQNYGKYEDGNKIDFSTFKKYLAAKYPAKKYDFNTQIYGKIKSLALDSIKATAKSLRSSNKPVFEIFGLDFMIDQQFKPWLIQVNTNPCLETTSMVLERIIPKMLDDAFQLSLDLMFPPPKSWPSSRRHLVPNHLQSGFELIFDQNQGQIFSNQKREDANEH